MKASQIVSLALILLFITSCKKETKPQTEQSSEQTEQNSTQTKTTESTVQNNKIETQTKKATTKTEPKTKDKATKAKPQNNNVETQKTKFTATKTEAKTPQTVETIKTNKVQSANKQENQADRIIGVWEVKNDYYMAIYEIEKYKGKYVGKIHYYNYGKTEYKGENSEKDYFLGGVTYENGSYKNGKMYMPDGSNYQVIFKLNNNNELEAKMTVQGSPYTEIWKRQTK